MFIIEYSTKLWEKNEIDVNDKWKWEKKIKNCNINEDMLLINFQFYFIHVQAFLEFVNINYMNLIKKY